MLKKTVTYTDPFGETITEDLYFHLTKAEMLEIEMSHKGGLSEAMKKIIATEDGGVIMSTFKEIILKAYGKREDGKFVKNAALSDAFSYSEAYSTVLMDIVTNTDAMVEFVTGIMPNDLAPEAERIIRGLEEEEKAPKLEAVREKPVAD